MPPPSAPLANSSSVPQTKRHRAVTLLPFSLVESTATQRKFNAFEKPKARPNPISHFCFVLLWRYLKLAHQFERFVAFVDLVHRQIAQALETECFYAKTCQHAAVDHRFAKISKGDLANCARQIAGHSTRKRVPCSGRIVNIFQRIRAAAEKFVFTKQQRA